jgi:site-specific recombinase
VFGLEVLERCLRRMEQMMDTLDAVSDEARAAAAHRLLAQMVLSSHKDRSMRHLVAWNTHLLQRKIVERTGRTGEHYIATTRAEYRHIWLAAAGGGLVMLGTAAVKLQLVGLSLAAFPEGVLAGINYAVGFLLLQAFGLMLATKQPAMTGAKLAELVRERRDVERRDEIAAYAARISHSQLAAALGNIVMVTLGAIAFSWVWQASVGRTSTRRVWTMPSAA